MHRHQELKNEKILLDGNIQSQNSFALSEVGSLYFGPNPSPEVGFPLTIDKSYKFS